MQGGPTTLTRDPYAVLGTSRDASTAELKRAYRRLARRHHPDAGGDPERFRELQDAWEVLGDPRARAAFDAATADAGAELAAAFARAREQVEHPATGGRSRRDEALLGTAAGAGVLATVAVLVALALDAAGVLEAPGAAVLFADAVLFVLLPPLAVALVSARSDAPTVLAGAAAGVVAVAGGLTLPDLDLGLLTAAMLAGAAGGTVVHAVRTRAG